MKNRSISADASGPVASVNEPVGAALVSAVFEVTLAGVPTAQTVTVAFATANVTASGGKCVLTMPGKPDYGTRESTLTFTPSGPRVQQIHVPICKDLREEPDETFTVALVNEANATVVNRTGTATIRGSR